MLTKYILHIGDESYQLQDDDLQNWDDIKCTIKRSGLDGAVRSFTSKFEFVNHAADLLTEEYFSRRLQSSASIEVKTISENWTYSTRFSCPLDFATIEIENGVVSMNAIDNSLAALIKANKSTKYEMTIGDEISVSRKLRMTRIPMCESLVYGFTQGESDENTGDIRVTFKTGELPWVGKKGEEILIGNAIDFNEDQETALSSYIFKPIKSVSVDFVYDIEYFRHTVNASVELWVRVKRGGAVLPVEGDGAAACYLGLIGNQGEYCLGYNLTSQSELPDLSQAIWIDTNSTDDARTHGYAILNGIVWKTEYHGDHYEWATTQRTTREYFANHLGGSATMSLQAGDVVYVESKVQAGFTQTAVSFAKSELRFEWFATGNDVYIDTLTPMAVAESIVNRMTGSGVPVEFSAHDPRLAKTYIMAAESIRDIDGAKLYTSFNDFCDWMSAVFGYVYQIDGNNIRFLHRSELFDAEAIVKEIENADGVKYSVDNSLIYSSVTAGYEKKDYESINGRNEFNFAITYSTGCTVTDKTLTLVSKYRADSYGIEFAVQKRAESTTDTASDKDVFFVLCTNDRTQLIVDRSRKITNCITGKLFNAAFSPAECIKANAGFIGLQADEMTLAFASSTGNSDVVIDNVSLSSDITLDSPIATCGVLDFSADTAEEEDIDSMIKVTDGTATYIGFVKELDLKYARAEAVKYKLIVKEVAP